MDSLVKYLTIQEKGDLVNDYLETTESLLDFRTFAISKDRLFFESSISFIERALTWYNEIMDRLNSELVSFSVAELIVKSNNLLVKQLTELMNFEIIRWNIREFM